MSNPLQHVQSGVENAKTAPCVDRVIIRQLLLWNIGYGSCLVAEPNLSDGSSGTCKNFPTVDVSTSMEYERLVSILPICGRTESTVNLNVTIGKHKISSVLSSVPMVMYLKSSCILRFLSFFRTFIKVVLEGYRRCPDSHDLSECHHLYDLGRHLLPPVSLTVLTLTPKNYLWKPSGATVIHNVNNV